MDPRFNPVLMETVKRIQSTLNINVVITSGYRPPCRNAAAGGSRSSQHLRGDAVDLRAMEISGPSYPYGGEQINYAANPHAPGQVTAKNSKTFAEKIVTLNLHDGDVFWNSCRPHVHLGLRKPGRKALSGDECGGMFEREEKNEK